MTPELWTLCSDDEAEGTLTKWTGLIEDVGLAVRRVPFDEAVQRMAGWLKACLILMGGYVPDAEHLTAMGRESLRAALGEDT